MYYRRPDSSWSPDLGDAAALSVGIRYSGMVRTKICQNAFNANQRPNTPIIVYYVTIRIHLYKISLTLTDELNKPCFCSNKICLGCYAC